MDLHNADLRRNSSDLFQCAFDLQSTEQPDLVARVLCKLVEGIDGLLWRIKFVTERKSAWVPLPYRTLEVDEQEPGLAVLIARQHTRDVEVGDGLGVVLHVLDVRTQTADEEGRDESLRALGDDVVVQVLYLHQPLAARLIMFCTYFPTRLSLVVVHG